MKIFFIFNHEPYQSICIEESFNMALACAALDHKVSLYFTTDAKMFLKPAQETLYYKVLEIYHMYDIEKIYAQDNLDSMETHILNIEFLSKEKLERLSSEADWVFTASI